MRIAVAAILALSLAACGSGGGGGSNAAAHAPACAAIGEPSALFGADVQIAGYAGPARPDGIGSTCEFMSADGRRGGDVILYTAASLGSVTAQAKFAEIVADWDADTETPLAPVNSLGDEAQIAVDLPGYQTHIAIRKGDTLILIAGRSGDPAVSGEQLARRMAAAVAHPDAP